MHRRDGQEIFEAPLLSPGNIALLRLCATLAMSSDSASIRRECRGALSAGATEDAIVAALTSIAPEIGEVAVVRAAPDIAAGIGYDIWNAFESS